MALIRLSASEYIDFQIYIIAASAKESEHKAELTKYFRLPQLEIFRKDRHQEFAQKYRLFLNSINSGQRTTIQIIQDGELELEPDEEKPSIARKLFNLIRRLTGTKNESLQYDILKEMVLKKEKKEQSLCEKYLK